MFEASEISHCAAEPKKMQERARFVRNDSLLLCHYERSTHGLLIGCMMLRSEKSHGASQDVSRLCSKSLRFLTTRQGPRECKSVPASFEMTVCFLSFRTEHSWSSEDRKRA